jgi:hypothetical protein
VFLPNGAVPKAGDKFLRTDLAKIIQFMADQDLVAGPDGHAGWRRADSGHAVGSAEYHAFRHGPADGDRGPFTTSRRPSRRSSISPAGREACRS